MTTGPEPGESQQILSTLTKVVRRRWNLIVLTVVGVLIPVTLYNLFTKPIYEAAASLVFEEVEDPIPEDVTAKTSAQQFLLNRLEEITSRAFAQDIAHALPENLLARFDVPADRKGRDRIEYITDQIHSSIDAYPLRNSNNFKIRVQMSDPYLSAAIANMSVRILQQREYQIHLRGVVELRKFLDRQLDIFSAKLEATEISLKDYKHKNGISSLDGESAEVLRRMTEAEVLYNANRADRDAAEKKLDVLNKALESERKDLVPSLTSIATPSVQKLKDKLVDLQTQYSQLIVQSYSPDHPQMVLLKQEIEQTKKALADEATKLVKDSNVGDPIAQIEQYVNESMSMQIDIASLNARESALGRTVQGYRGYLGGLPAKELDLARLIRERDVNQKIYTTLLERREEVRIAEAKQIPNSRVIDWAAEPKSPVKPRKALNFLLGTVLALMVGTGLGMVVEGGSREVESTLTFERDTSWPVLALVPEMDQADGWLRLPWSRRPSSYVTNALTSHLKPQSAPGESYLILRTRLELLGVGTKYRTVMITSGGPGEGKSTTLANLAGAFAAGGRSTVVVDAELRRPVLHEVFSIPKAPGLSDVVIARNGKGNGVAHRPPGKAAAIPLIETSVPGVQVLPSGKRVQEVHWELSMPVMKEVLEELKQKYEVVLVDSASPALVHDTMVLCGLVDAVIVVVDSGAYDLERVMEIKRLLEPAGANVLGAVVTKIHPISKYGYYYSAYYSHEKT